ncbi:hypothetical protein ACFL21_00615 [Patescibacteria group bacterium]
MKIQEYPQSTKKVLTKFYKKFPGYKEYLENFFANNSYYKVLCIKCARNQGLTGAMVSAEQIPCYVCGNMPFAIFDEHQEASIYSGNHLDFFTYKYHVDAGKLDKNGRRITNRQESADFEFDSEYLEAYKKMSKLIEFELKQTEKNLKNDLERVIEKMPSLISLINSISYIREHRNIQDKNDNIFKARLQNLIDYIKNSPKKKDFKKILKKTFIKENL